MTSTHISPGRSLVRSQLGSAADEAIAALHLEELLDATDNDRIDRVTIALALNIVLFHKLLQRVPPAAAYVADVRAEGRKVHFDHGALRTVRFGDATTGELPPGERAFARILLALGYRVAGLYPLPKLRMTGRAYSHADAPGLIPQFFVSELHVEQFSAGFQEAADRIFASSIDPLDDMSLQALRCLESGLPLPFPTAEHLLGDLAAAFSRRHTTPRLADYETLLAESAEAAWIATEGNAFNHATDRVADVARLAEAERKKGRPVKDRIEVSASGRVRQTAYRAATVRRRFIDRAGHMVERDVPGSFYEFIERDIDPETGAADLRFDSANATGIFAMTRAA